MNSWNTSDRFYIHVYGLILTLTLLYMLHSSLDIIVYAVFPYYITRPIKRRLVK